MNKSGNEKYEDIYLLTIIAINHLAKAYNEAMSKDNFTQRNWLRNKKTTETLENNIAYDYTLDNQTYKYFI